MRYSLNSVFVSKEDGSRWRYAKAGVCAGDYLLIKHDDATHQHSVDENYLYEHYIWVEGFHVNDSQLDAEIVEISQLAEECQDRLNMLQNRIKFIRSNFNK